MHLHCQEALQLNTMTLWPCFTPLLGQVARKRRRGGEEEEEVKWKISPFSPMLLIGKSIVIFTGPH